MNETVMAKAIMGLTYFIKTSSGASQFNSIKHKLHIFYQIINSVLCTIHPRDRVLYNAIYAEDTLLLSIIRSAAKSRLTEISSAFSIVLGNVHDYY